VQVEAARAKLIIDRRLKQQTPDWIKRVAQGLPPQ
jgi:hypothetical protein